ncbi:DUF2783 domain-containing protein [Roseospira goensis]|uniref:DUF2783 domain-containing protein n=1 Tax=Roseospira goensis TaxID=391922 RepID=A0A7W6S0K5_9PROT|nr:DUF2783 domain-containing protein [Roseospira goensis]MBB4286059.1 hypothetical protein [Roseospira goensis]
MTLNVQPNLPDPDGFYERLVALHRGLDADQSAVVNARLILLLANHIGDPAVLDRALALARDPATHRGDAAAAG